MKRIALLALIATACASHPGGWKPVPLVTQDDDRHPIKEPDEYWSSLYWDGADQMVFLPMHRALLVDVGGPAVNVNAYGEVPNSSWFTNRIGRTRISPERLVRGPCAEDDYLSSGPWLAKSGKVDGANPGFVIEDAQTHKRYVLKFDSKTQPERASSGDVIGSKLYWAFGASVPCNFVVTFDASTVQLAPDATQTDRFNNKVPLTQQDVDRAMQSAARTPDGKLRASASMFVTGKPIGPWTYQGKRGDDPNDAFDHEDRRDLRGARLMAAWTQHFDAREQNTLSTFMKAGDGELGWVEHWTIDFGDTLGSLWAADDMSRRFGHSYYFDFADVFSDLFTLGFRKRPWEQVQKDPKAEIWGYYEHENFEPEDWKGGYQNIAFIRMDDADAYWAAHIISRFTDAHIDALVAAAQLSKREYGERLREVLIQRRNRIVDRYMSPMASFENPVLDDSRLCFEDAMVTAGRLPTSGQRYETRFDDGPWVAVSAEANGKVCTALEAGASRVEARITRPGADEPTAPVAFHLHREGSATKLIGIERKTP
ncbi:MAG: hypothetical protein ACAI38_07600 [Myxococcota bacterium]